MLNTVSKASLPSQINSTKILAIGAKLDRASPLLSSTSPPARWGDGPSDEPLGIGGLERADVRRELDDVDLPAPAASDSWGGPTRLRRRSTSIFAAFSHSGPSRSRCAAVNSSSDVSRPFRRVTTTSSCASGTPGTRCSWRSASRLDSTYTFPSLYANHTGAIRLWPFTRVPTQITSDFRSPSSVSLGSFCAPPARRPGTRSPRGPRLRG